MHETSPHEASREPAPDPGRDAAHVVFLHGQPGAGSDWDAVVRALPSQLRSNALDRPGYRSSPFPAGSFTDNARWLITELDDAGISDAILVGHSYGGGVALTAAALAPDRVQGLVLVASVGPHCLDGWDRLLAAPVAGPVCAVAAWWLTPWFARRRLARLERLRKRPFEGHEHVNLEGWGNARHEHGAMWRTFLTEQRELVGGLDRLTARLGQIVAPTVVIADPTDKMIPVATAHALHARLARSRLALVEEGGHHLPRRNPQAIAAEITRFAAQFAVTPQSRPGDYQGP
jgi:pimeloyl-ACP methyl ester carboxylesterase